MFHIGWPDLELSGIADCQLALAGSCTSQCVILVLGQLSSGWLHDGQIIINYHPNTAAKSIIYGTSVIGIENIYYPFMTDTLDSGRAMLCKHSNVSNEENSYCLLYWGRDFIYVRWSYLTLKRIMAALKNMGCFFLKIVVIY